MGAFIYWTPKLIGLPTTLWFDLVTEESHQLKNDVTSFPVEEGVEITDHVRPEVDHVTLSVFVSNEPLVSLPDVIKFTKKIGKTVGANIGAPVPHLLDVPTYEPPLAPTPGSVLNALTSAISNLLTGRKQYVALTLTFPAPFDNVQDVYDTLRDVRDNAIRVDCITSTRTYKDMIIEDLQMIRNAETGTGAKFEIQLKQIRLVSTLKIKAPVPVESKGFERKNAGSKGPTAADDPTKRASALVGMGAAAGIFTGGATGL